MTRVVLVGAGHVHMAVLAHTQRLRAAGIELTLVDPGSFWYGAQPADVMTGQLKRDHLRVAPSRLCQARGVHHCRDRAIGLDTRHRRLWLAAGDRLEYDRVSLNVGAECDMSGFDDDNSGVQVWRAGAVEQLLGLADALAQAGDRARPPRVAVVGAGRRAAELVAGLSMAASGQRCRLAWYLHGATAVPDAPASAVRRVLRVLARRDIDILASTPIDGMANGCLHSRDGRRFPVDHILFAGPARAAPLIHASKLPADVTGLCVTPRLHSPPDKRVFAAGGCACPAGRHSLDTADIRGQARVLIANLVASVGNRPLKSCRPARRAGSVDLADGRAVVWRGRLWCHNRIAARLRQRRAARLREWLVAAGDGR